MRAWDAVSGRALGGAEDSRSAPPRSSSLIQCHPLSEALLPQDGSLSWQRGWSAGIGPSVPGLLGPLLTWLSHSPGLSLPKDGWQASDTAQGPSRSLASPLTWVATPTCSLSLHSWALLTISITLTLTPLVNACSLLPGELGPCGLEKTDEQGQ